MVGCSSLRSLQLRLLPVTPNEIAYLAGLTGYLQVLVEQALGGFQNFLGSNKGHHKLGDSTVQVSCLRFAKLIKSTQRYWSIHVRSRPKVSNSCGLIARRIPCDAPLIPGISHVCVLTPAPYGQWSCHKMMQPLSTQLPAQRAT